MSKLRDIFKNNVAKKTVYDKLSAKANNIDTSSFVLKTKYQTDKTELEKEAPNVTDFVKKTKRAELENKISDISNLAAKAAITTVENKIPSVNKPVKNKQTITQKLVKLKKKKKITDHNHDKYITTPEFNTLAASAFNARLSQANLITKTDFDTKVSSLDSKTAANEPKNESIENKLKEGLACGFFLTIGTIYFDAADGSQVYLKFQPVHRYFKIITNTRYIFWMDI